MISNMSAFSSIITFFGLLFILVGWRCADVDFTAAGIGLLIIAIVIRQERENPGACPWDESDKTISKYI